MTRDEMKTIVKTRIHGVKLVHWDVYDVRAALREQMELDDLHITMDGNLYEGTIVRGDCIIFVPAIVNGNRYEVCTKTEQDRRITELAAEIHAEVSAG